MTFPKKKTSGYHFSENDSQTLVWTAYQGDIFFYGKPSITFEKSDRRSSVLKNKITLVISPKKRLAITFKHLAITFELILTKSKKFCSIAVQF